MLTLPCTVLRHDTGDAIHYDWLLGDPSRVGDIEARLWTARTVVPPRAWPTCGAWMLERLGHHRRRYLTHQGPLPGPGRRGHVTRVARGTHLPRLWTASRIVTHLACPGIDGGVELWRVSDERWRARWLGATSLSGYDLRLIPSF